MIRQLSCIIAHLKKNQINLNLSSFGLGTIIHRLNVFFSNKTTFLYYGSPNNISNQLKSMQCKSRNDNTSISSGFLVIRQLSCIIAHLKTISNQLKSMLCRSRKHNTLISSGFLVIRDLSRIIAYLKILYFRPYNVTTSTWPWRDLDVILTWLWLFTVFFYCLEEFMTENRKQTKSKTSKTSQTLSKPNKTCF